MKLLCILDKFPAADFRDPEAINKKGGLFPVALHALVEAGHEVMIAGIDRRDSSNERLLAEQLGCEYPERIGPVRPRAWLEVARALRYRSVTLPQWSLRVRLRKGLRYRRQKVQRITGAARIITDLERIRAGGRRFDHIIGMTSYDDSGLLADLVAGRFECPFSVWEHQTHYARHKLSRERIRKTRAAALRAHVTAAVSPQLRDEMARTLGADVPLTVVPNPIGDDFFTPPAAAVREPVDAIRGDGFLFAAWTAWRDFKRLDVALDAFARVVADGADARFLVAGRPPEAARIQARRLGIADRVTFLGNVGRDHIKGIAYACDCVVVPSDFETFGLPVVEAMAAGNPVVATRCGGPESIVVDDRLGYIVERGDVPALAERMRAVMDDRARYDDDFIRDWCREHYGERAYARRWDAILEPEPAGRGESGAQPPRADAPSPSASR